MFLLEFSDYLNSYQQAVVLSRCEVGVAQVTGRLQHPDYTLHVTGEAEAVMGHNQQLYD